MRPNLFRRCGYRVQAVRIVKTNRDMRFRLERTRCRYGEKSPRATRTQTLLHWRKIHIPVGLMVAQAAILVDTMCARNCIASAIYKVYRSLLPLFPSRWLDQFKLEDKEGLVAAMVSLSKTIVGLHGRSSSTTRRFKLQILCATVTGVV